MTQSDLSFLHPPCRLQMLWQTSEGEPAAYYGRLREVTDEHLDVHLLGYGLVPCALRAGEEVSLRITAEQSVYEIPSRVVSLDISGDLLAEVNGNVKRLDRRRYPRVRVHMAATTAFLPGPRNHPPLPVTVRIVDLSDGGAKLESFTRLEPGQPLQLMIPIPGHTPIFPSGVVRDVSPITAEGPAADNRYAIRVKFTGVLQTERRILLKYVAREKERAV